MGSDTALKPPDEMTVGALKDEIREHNEKHDAKLPLKGNKPVLKATVTALRALAGESAAGTDEKPVEPADAPEAAAPAPHEPDTRPDDDDEIKAALALREVAIPARSNPIGSLPAVEEFNAAMAVAERLANSKIVPADYRGRPDDIFAAYLFGKALGLDLMTALRDLYMIDGRAAIAAHRQLGIIRAGGVVILDSDSNDERAFIHAKRLDTGEEMRVEFTYEEAQKVVRKGKPLVDGDNWRNYRKDMLWARTVGRLSRRLGPDLIGGNLPPYVAEEVADFEGWGVEYGSQGQLSTRRGQPRQEIPEYRKEKPDYNWPSSWGELIERLVFSIGESDEVQAWMQQGLAALYPDIEILDSFKATLQSLSGQLRAKAFQKFSGALSVIDELPDLKFSPDPRGEISKAFAKYLDGTVLDGPPWRIGPSEDDRPTRDEIAEEVVGEVVIDPPEGEMPYYAANPDIEFGPRGD